MNKLSSSFFAKISKSLGKIRSQAASVGVVFSLFRFFQFAFFQPLLTFIFIFSFRQKKTYFLAFFSFIWLVCCNIASSLQAVCLHKAAHLPSFFYFSWGKFSSGKRGLQQQQLSTSHHLAWFLSVDSSIFLFLLRAVCVYFRLSCVSFSLSLFCASAFFWMRSQKICVLYAMWVCCFSLGFVVASNVNLYNFSSFCQRCFWLCRFLCACA